MLARRIDFLLFCLLLAGLSWLPAQAPSATGAQPGQSGQPTTPSTGMANAGPQEAQFDAQHRPITAGGFVKTGPIIFQDVAEAAGLTSWHHKAGTPEKRLILEAKGPGVCLIDYDNDGWLDIYLVNGSTYDALTGKATPPHAALFHNNHDGTFTDVTEKAGVANDRWGYGCAVGDYDNDGWPDLYVTNYGKNRLYRNNHDGTFTDVAEKAGVGIGTWSTGATFGDYDGDGRLDLFVDGYAQIDLSNPPLSRSKAIGYGMCQYRGVEVMCGPRGLKGEHDHLFHNNGDGTFTDVSKKLGVDDPNGYYGLGALFADVNNDGKPDLLVANDSTPNYLYMNKGNGTFEDDSYESGYALNKDGREIANMGIAAGDYENNGHLSIVNTDFADDYNVLFQNDGTGFFTDVSYQAGIAESSIPFVGFADGFLDYDNDGWKDLLIINGHVYPQVDQHPEWGQSYAQRPLLYHNERNGKFDAGSRRRRHRPRSGVGRPRRGIWRHLQRRQDRRGHQQHGWRSDAAAQRQPGPSSLGGDEADRRTEKSSRCGRSDRLPDRGRNAAAGRCPQRWQLSFFERLARSFRARRRPRRRHGRDSLAERQKGVNPRACRGPHLHDRGRAGYHRCLLRSQAV